MSLEESKLQRMGWLPFLELNSDVTKTNISLICALLTDHLVPGADGLRSPLVPAPCYPLGLLGDCRQVTI